MISSCAYTVGETVGAFYETDYYKDLGVVTRPPWTMVLSREAFPRNPHPINAADVTHVDALFLGHAHGDHMSDAAQVAQQTGTKVYAPKFAYEKLMEQGVPGTQVHYVQTGEVYDFKGFTVEAIHINHSGINGLPPAPQGPTPTSGAALNATPTLLGAGQ